MSFFGLLSAALLAQTPDTATIHGHIVDQSRGAVPGAGVTQGSSGFRAGETSGHRPRRRRFQLNVASGSAQITLTGTVGEIRTDAPQLGDRIAGRQLQETPMLDRRITYLPLLNSANRPAINQGDIFINQNLFTTNGAGRRQTWQGAEKVQDKSGRR